MSVNHHPSDFNPVLQLMRQKNLSLGALFKIFHDSTSDKLQTDKSLYGTFAKDALPWAFEAIKTELCQEVHQLSQRSHFISTMQRLLGTLDSCRNGTIQFYPSARRVSASTPSSPPPLSL